MGMGEEGDFWNMWSGLSTNRKMGSHQPSRYTSFRFCWTDWSFFLWGKTKQGKQIPHSFPSQIHAATTAMHAGGLHSSCWNKWCSESYLHFCPIPLPPQNLPTSETFLPNPVISLLFPRTLKCEVWQVSLGITLQTYSHCKFSRSTADTGQNTLALFLCKSASPG